MRVNKEVRRMIQLNDIYKTFHKGTVNEKKALNGLNLQMKKGDFVTVIGGNGAGKSTMLNVIAGVYLSLIHIFHWECYIEEDLP